MIRKENCILCGNRGESKVLNDLRIFACSHCDLTWRETFDISIDHYEEKGVDFADTKTRSRLANSHERIKTFKKHAPLDNLCDVGCGEGIFLQALKEEGYVNCIGIEPSSNVSLYATDHGLTIYKGTAETAEELLNGKGIQTISMFHLIEHLHDPLHSVRSLWNALPNEGRLIVETPDFHCTSFRRAGYRHKLIYEEHLFYFSKKSLSILLEKAGFSIIASGKRDFDLHNMPIRELLVRLGLVKSRQAKNAYKVRQQEMSPASHAPQREGVLRKWIRKILATVVEVFDRGDYIWIIAQKS